MQNKLDQLQKKQPQMDKLQKLAQQMGQIQQGLQQGDGKQAAEAMAQMARQLEKMQQDMNEMEMLDAAMEQIEMAKDAMGCKSCDGEGCENCKAQMMANNNMKNMNGKPGRGMNQGIGIGARPEEKNNTNLRDSQVRTNPKRGAATFGGFVDGPNIKGDVSQNIKEEMASLGAEPADPLTSERLPNSRREHAEQYFQMLRDGK